MLLIVWFYKGWTRIPQFTSSDHGKTYVSVIIPFRDEETNIPLLLKALKSQNYSNDRWKAIFVDDHSVDQSSELIKSGFPEAEIIQLPADIFGKKSALEFGAHTAKSDLLLFTDADCIPGRNWISTIVSRYENGFPVLISGPVIMDAGNSFLSNFQALEFLSLIGSGAASFGNNNPIMANGANLAVRRDIYIESLENRYISTPSGDDIFLVLSLKNKYPGKLVFLKSEDAIVRTFPMPDLLKFIRQRLRWTSKSRYYKDKFIIITSLLVFIVNFWLLVCFVSGFFILEFFIAWGMIFILKSIADRFFLKKVASFSGQGSLLRIFVLSQFVYFLYIVFTGIAGNLIKVKWKERIIIT